MVSGMTDWVGIGDRPGMGFVILLGFALGETRIELLGASSFVF